MSSAAARAAAARVPVARVVAARATPASWAAAIARLPLAPDLAARISSAPLADLDVWTVSLEAAVEVDPSVPLALAAIHVDPGAPGVAELILLRDPASVGWERALGRFLLTTAAAEIRARGFRRVFARRRADDAAAARLHAHLGLAVEGVERAYHADGTDRVTAAWVRSGAAA